MIICFEGPSAIGKTKLSEIFSKEYNVIPEVNQLFDKGDLKSKYWYYEKQVERYQMCKKSKQRSILDGDIFQPIWYNWIYNYPSEYLSKRETHKFYLEKINEEKIGFPDMYIVFQIGQNELRKRKERDQTRTRRNFEKHLKYIQSQKEYFKFLKENTELDVEFVDYTDIKETRDKVVSLIESNSEKDKNNLSTFEKIIELLIESK